jgi:hypothetical protein
MSHEAFPTTGREADDAPPDLAQLTKLAERFVEQRQPAASPHEVLDLFQHLLATVYAGATITRYLPVLLWREAQERWPRGSEPPQPA